MQQLSTRHAVLLALGTAVISGTANYISKIAVTVVRDPIVFTFLKNGLVAVMLFGICLVFLQWKRVRTLSRSEWAKLILIGVVGGSVPFILYFTGLTLTSAISASFIHKTMFVWVAMLAVPFLKERLSWIQGVALLLLVGGNLALLGTQSLSLGKGELLIFIATLFWAVETVIAKRTLANVSSTLVASARMIIGSIVLLVVVVVQGKVTLLAGLSGTQWGWTLLIAGLLLAYVLTWFKALQHAPATIVTSILVPASLITTLLSMIFRDATLTIPQAVSGVLFIGALVLVIRSVSTTPHTHADHNANQHI